MSFGQRPVAKSARAFNCPHCGGPVNLRAAGISVTAVCQQCGTIIDTASSELKVIQAATAANFNTPLDIGWRGELDGITWEIIGCTRKSLGITVFRWEEYLLFNPWHGFRFLSQVDGHWTFFKRLNRRINGIGSYNALTVDGTRYSVFNKDTVRVDAVKGEFYWRVKAGDESYACDYVRAPFMLSSEETGDELNVSLGRYVSKGEMKRAFPDASLPWVSGVGACQPFGIRNVRQVFVLGAVAAAAAICVHIAVGVASPNTTVVDISGQPIRLKTVPEPAAAARSNGATFSWGSPTPENTAGESITSQPFELTRDSNLRIETHAGIDNAWADFDLTLVNETTGRDFDIHQPISYYYGVDGGEAWHEGKTYKVSYTPVLPKGRYHLLVDSDSDVLGKAGELPFSIEIRNGVTESWNLWVALLLIAIFPAWVGFRYWSFESTRWSNSDYTPTGQFNTGADDT